MARDVLYTPAAVIAALGGSNAVARLTGRQLAAVANWRRFETLPANTYLVLTQALRAKRLSAPPWLWNMEPRPVPLPESPPPARSRKIAQPEVA
jgi:hypothetical protein